MPKNKTLIDAIETVSDTIDGKHYTEHRQVVDALGVLAMALCSCEGRQRVEQRFPDVATALCRLLSTPQLDPAVLERTDPHIATALEAQLFACAALATRESIAACCTLLQNDFVPAVLSLPLNHTDPDTALWTAATIANLVAAKQPLSDTAVTLFVDHIARILASLCAALPTARAVPDLRGIALTGSPDRNVSVVPGTFPALTMAFTAATMFLQNTDTRTAISDSIAYFAQFCIMSDEMLAAAIPDLDEETHLLWCLDEREDFPYHRQAQVFKSQLCDQQETFVLYFDDTVRWRS